MMKWILTIIVLVKVIMVEAGVISTQVFEDFCKFKVYSNSGVFNPDEVEAGDTIYVRVSALDNFFKNYFPLILKPFVLITGRGLGTVDKKYIPYLEGEKLIHWFGINITIKHPKLTIIPLGVPWNAKNQMLVEYEDLYSNCSVEKFFMDKPIFIYVNWKKTDPSREVLLNYYETIEGCEIVKSTYVQKFMLNVEASKYVISPRGYNIDCFRTWEALYAGSIPVVQSYGIDAVYDDLPIIIVPDLAKVTPEILEIELEKLKSRTFNLEKLGCEYWFNLIRSYCTGQNVILSAS